MVKLWDIVWLESSAYANPGHYLAAYLGLPRPGIIPSRPNKIFLHDLIEHCVSYLFGIVQSSISLDSIIVCSSRSTSIWVTLLGFPKQHFWSSLFIAACTMAG